MSSFKLINFCLLVSLFASVMAIITGVLSG